MSCFVVLWKDQRHKNRGMDLVNFACICWNTVLQDEKIASLYFLSWPSPLDTCKSLRHLTWIPRRQWYAPSFSNIVVFIQSHNLTQITSSMVITGADSLSQEASPDIDFQSMAFDPIFLHLEGYDFRLSHFNFTFGFSEIAKINWHKK